MNKSIKLGKIAGLELSIRPSAIITVFVVWGLLTVVAFKFFKLKPKQAIVSGFVGTLLHWLSELFHNFGHARAADLTGFPMQGIDFWGPIATSVYPENEGSLTPDIHIQRALGGPIFSLALTILAGVVAFALKPLGGPAAFTSFFLFADNLLVFTVGAMLPPGFTDGSTLITWLRQRHPQTNVVINGI